MNILYLNNQVVLNLETRGFYAIYINKRCLESKNHSTIDVKFYNDKDAYKINCTYATDWYLFLQKINAKIDTDHHKMIEFHMIKGNPIPSCLQFLAFFETKIVHYYLNPDILFSYNRQSRDTDG